jgi:hypothetical protein
MSTPTVSAQEAFRSMVYGLVPTAMFVSMIVKQKKAAKAKKPIPLTPKYMEIITYICLAFMSLGMLVLFGVQLAALRG